MPSPKDYLTALLRAGVQGTASDAVAGLAGLARGGDVETIRQVQELTGYEPQGAEAEALANVGEFMAPVTEPIGRAVDWVGEQSPVAGAALQALPVALGAPAAMRVGRGAAKALRTMSDEIGSPGNQKGYFRYHVGPGDPRHAREVELAGRAEERLTRGEDPAAVWRDLNWGREPMTGRLVTEIDDSQMKLMPGLLRRGGGTEPKLYLGTGDPNDEFSLNVAVRHPELMRDIIDKTPGSDWGRVTLGQNAPTNDYLGSWTPWEKKIRLAPRKTEDEILSTLTHEYQHGIQDKFGMPTGSNADYYGYSKHELNALKASRDAGTLRTMLLDDPSAAGLDPMARQSLWNILGTLREKPDILDPYTHDWDAIQGLPKGFINDERKRIISDLRSKGFERKGHINERNRSFKRYQDTAGEAMARLAQERRTLDALARGQRYPFDPNYFQATTGSQIGDLKSYDDPTGYTK